MNLSIGEFRALVAKAFRGAGYSWGLTEEAAAATVRLAEHGIDVGAVVVRLLEATGDAPIGSLMPTDEWEPQGDFLCPVCVGATLIDLGRCPEITLDNLVEPLLLAPFLMMLAESESTDYLISWGGGHLNAGSCEIGSCEVGSDHLVVNGALPTTPELVTIRHHDAVASRRSKSIEHTSWMGRVELDEATRATIESFAHRTYAPATEASRLSGAGTGLLGDE